MKLKIENLSFKYPNAKKYLLKDVNLELDNKKIVGTLISLDSSEGSVKLIGEIANNRFVPGVLNKPAIVNVCFISTDAETKLIVVDEQGNNVIKKVLVGTMPLYNNKPG